MTEAERLARDANVPLELAQLVVMAANRIEIPLRKLRAPDMHRPLVEARRTVVLQARRRAKPFSYWQIARALNRDHSTIIHAERPRRFPDRRRRYLDEAAAPCQGSTP